MPENALPEGGPRNGVRTAIEDAIQPHHDQFHILWLDGLLGLAEIVPQARLRANPRLADVLARITPSREMRQLIRVLEKERLDGALAMGQLHRLQGAEMPKCDSAISARPFDSALDPGLLQTLQAGVFTKTYKDRMIMLNPFHMANLLQLLQEVRPATVFEIGTGQGGANLLACGYVAGAGLRHADCGC
jgi:hypothetical protein